MRRIIIALLVGASLVSGMVLAGCGGTAIAPAGEGKGNGKTETAGILVENTSISLSITPVKPDYVELIYFHTKNPCHCMAVVGDNIQYAVGAYFKDEVASGRVKLTMIVSDDPANAEIVKRYDAMPFVLFIKETREDKAKTYPVGDIWNMTGDDNRDKLINFIRVIVTDILEGK